ncbi:MAG: prepilin-type N-terminal cleavage/methylation domain-containing protein [Alphaproteobacteria bacterium]|nr:prepilin-type N-terminal cleavage/methylation domain-containing protein [Alphaproteobacteria bacterium]
MRRQAGFTFLELTIAAAASGIIMLTSAGFLVKALGWYDELNAKLEMNRHARETFRLLAYGGMATSNGNDGTKYLYGIRGRAAAPSSGLRNNYALQYTSNNLTLTPDKFAAMTITCTAAANPLPDCGGSGSKTVQGWLGNDVTFQSSSRSVAGDTVEMTFTVTDPYQIQRAKSAALFTDTYRTVFTLNRMESDP